MDGIRDIGTVKIVRSQRDRWKQEAELLEGEVAEDPANAGALFWRSGGLASEWARRFPELFDEEDRRLVIRQGKYGWHFVEWVAAILLYHRTGYVSLVSKYEFAPHPRKQEIVEKVLPAPVLTVLRDRTAYGRTQGPDLLMYAPDFSEWFFCEVKGPGDRLGPKQKRKFEELATVSAKDVQLVRLRWAPAVDRLFHIAGAEDWEEAQHEGAYCVSTIDRGLEDEGFIHLSFAHQIKTVADALYRSRSDLLLLAIDPPKLNCPVVVEDRDGSGSWFPHAYGELNLDAIEDARPFPPNQDGTFPDITERPPPREQRQWDRESFLAELLEKRGPEETRVARRLYKWTFERGWKQRFRGGVQQGSWQPVRAVNGRELGPIMIDTHPSGRIQVLFQYLQRYPPFDDERKRLELLDRINEIPGVSFPREVITKRPRIALSLLAADGAALDPLKRVLEWFEVQVGKTA